MNIDSIQNGVVLDHIQAGKSMDIYRYLHLDQLDCSVAIIKNVRSGRMGKKDIIKIEDEENVDLDVLGLVARQATVGIVRGGKIVGYTSVRRQPSRAKIAEITATYKEWLAKEGSPA